MPAATSNQGDEPSLQKKPLTKQTLHAISRKSAWSISARYPLWADDAGVALVDDEEEIISEVVIRERLIEWLAGFLA